MYNIGNVVNNILINLYGCCSVPQLCPILATPCTAAYQASLSFTSLLQWSLLNGLMSVESMMPSNHLILCCSLLPPPSIFPSIRVFSNELALCIRCPKYWSFSVSISPSNEYSGLISLGWTGWISLQSKGLSRVFSDTTVQKHQFFSSLSLLYCLSHQGNPNYHLSPYMIFSSSHVWT